jgi:hypothetical protein
METLFADDASEGTYGAVVIAKSVADRGNNESGDKNMPCKAVECSHTIVTGHEVECIERGAHIGYLNGCKYKRWVYALCTLTRSFLHTMLTCKHSLGVRLSCTRA